MPTDRETDIQRRWELVTGTGVIVRPMAATVQAVGNQGFDVRAAEALLPEGQRLYDAGAWNQLLPHLARIHAALRAAPARPLPGIARPADWPAIAAALPPSPALPAYDRHDYAERVAGGWLGKIIGGALGGPVEGWPSTRIAETYGTVSGYLAPPTSLNDDTAYPLLVLHTIEGHGPAFTSAELALQWLEHLPLAYTAEQVALENLKLGFLPPESGRRDNPCSHWIGAMMKAEIAGWLAPAQPRRAAELAYRDAIIAHETEGVYGALFNAAMTAAAFVEPDPRRLIELALTAVPPHSQCAGLIRQVVAWCAAADTWQSAWQAAEREIAGRYHWIHTFPNLAAVIVALWFGAGDFARSICLATQCGGDTDCTAGQVGAILGTAQGASAIPAAWRTPLGDQLESYVIGFEQQSLADLTARTVAAGRQVLAS